jgi:hypothetical protein
MVANLPSMHKALSSNLTTAKKKKKKRITKIYTLASFLILEEMVSFFPYLL